MHVIGTGQSLRRAGLGGHVSSEVQGQSGFPEQQMSYLWSLQVAEITVSALSACSSYGLVGVFLFHFRFAYPSPGCRTVP